MVTEISKDSYNDQIDRIAIYGEDADSGLLVKPKIKSGKLQVDDAAIGTATDAPASTSSDEDTTARTHTSILKALKNLEIDVKTAVEALNTKTPADPATAAGITALAAKFPNIGNTLTPIYGTDTSLCAATAVAISTPVALGVIDCAGYNKLILDWKLIWANGSGTGTAYIDVWPQDVNALTYTKAMTSKRIAVAPVTGSPFTAQDFAEIDVAGLKSITLYCTGSTGAALTATVLYRLVV